MADDELRRVPPDIAVKVGRIGNLGGNAGIVLVPVWDGGLFLFIQSLGLIQVDFTMYILN